MLHLRGKAATLLTATALTLTLGGAITTATPASALVFTQQCDQSRGCMNLWNGGYAVKSYYGTAANNEIAVQWISSTQFELRDNVHGGCIGDLNGTSGDARAGGGQSCPSSGSAGWGTIFTADHSVCPSGWAGYRNRHWGGYIFIPAGNGAQIYLNSGVDCLRQET